MGRGGPFTVDSYTQKIQTELLKKYTFVLFPMSYAADLYPLYMHIKILTQAIVKTAPTKTEQDENYMPRENFHAAILKAYA